MKRDEEFVQLLRALPLVSVDLVLVRDGREILLGLRNNRPAQGSWFVPGGRIFKDKMAIGPHGFIALVHDTEGNLIGLHSMA